MTLKNNYYHMKTTISNKLPLLLFCFLFTISLHGQNTREIMRRFKQEKHALSTKPTDWKKDSSFISTYLMLENLTRNIYGKVPLRKLGKTPVVYLETPFDLEYYDLDNDGKADEFCLLEKNGRTTKEFGFIYDLNNDGKTDYIVYNGGLMNSSNNDFYYYFYHFIDRNADGHIDCSVNSVIVQPNDSLPNPQIILWTRDDNFNGAVNSLQYINIHTLQSTPVDKTGNIWHYQTAFGKAQINDTDKTYFNGISELLSLLNNQ
jgi:hypothetical protein